MRVFRNINIKETGAFQYLQVPMELVTDSYYGNKSPFGKPLSGEAKILYSLMLNRTGLSREKNWVTESGDVYIIYTIKQIEGVMSCANQKAGKMLKELEAYGLIEKKRRGQGKPDIIFVKAFYDIKDGEDGCDGQINIMPGVGPSMPLEEPEESINYESKIDTNGAETLDITGEIQKCENHISRSVKTTSLEMWKSHAIYKDIYNSGLDNYYCEGGESDGWQQKIKEQIKYDWLIEEFPKEEVKKALESIIYVEVTEDKELRIKDSNLQLEELRESFRNLSYEMVKEVIENALTTKKNKHRNYYILALFNQVKATRNFRPKRNGFNNFSGRDYPPEYYKELERMMVNL